MDSFRRLSTGDEHAAARRLHPAERATKMDRLAGHDAGRRKARVHRVGVHHPRHDLRIGIDVRCRYVPLRTDDDSDLAGIAPRQLFQFFA
jgi:hypothetical protein